MIKKGDDVRFRKPGLKWTTVIEGQVVSIDAQGVASIAIRGETVVSKVHVDKLERTSNSVVRVRPPSGSILSQLR